VSGPFGTDILSALGATVIKIEPPATGDYVRRLAPPWITRDGPTLQAPADDDYVALHFLKKNAAKLSLALDVASAEGARTLRRLCESADALVHNLKPTSAKRFGITAAELQRVNPRLVCCALDGLGPYADEDDRRQVIDMAAQALSGAMTTTGDPDGPPVYLGIAVGDISGGIYAAIAVLAGLLGRDGKRGRDDASSFSVSLLGSLSALMGKQFDAVVRYGLRERTAGRSLPGFLVNRLFRTADGKWAYISGINQEQWERIVQATALTELADPRYAKPAGRLPDQERIEALLDDWAAALTRDEMLARLAAHGVSAWPVRDSFDLMADERFRRCFYYEVEHPLYGPTGFHSAVSPVVADDERDWMEDAPAPMLGQHSREILRRYGGLSKEEIAELERRGVVRSFEAGE
jgi:crotonobetainyl-CoA:carnitine CoA-transferase CaiB-like acyl-CoA transferase